MSENQYADILDENEDFEPQAQESENGPKALRDHAKKLEKEVAELRKFKAEQERKVRESEVASKLAAAGLPEGAAKFAAGAEDIDAWIQENRGLFGGAGSTPEPEVDPSAPVGAPSLSPEQIQQMQAVRVQPGSFQPGGASQLNAALDKAQTKEELIAILAQQGRLAR